MGDYTREATVALFCHTQIQQSSGLNRKSERETGERNEGGYVEMCSDRRTQGKTESEREGRKV